MLDLNVDADSPELTQCGGSSNVEKQNSNASGTSNSSVVSADGGGDEASCSTRTAFTLSFDILKVGGEEDKNDAVVTKDLFPLSGGGTAGHAWGFPEFEAQSSSSKNWIDLSFERPKQDGDVPVIQQASQPVKKSRRGPRSRSSQYRGVTFYRRTGRWESHIWDCGKQVYLGGFDTAHAAARAYDRAAIKFRGLEADINFNLTDYEEDMKQMQNLSKEEFVQVLRRQSNGFSRGSSKYRGVTLHKCGRWDTQMGQFLGKKAYDKAALAVPNFEPSTYERKMTSEGHNEGGLKLDLNLGMSLPSRNVTDQSKSCLPSHSNLYQMQYQASSRMENPATSNHPIYWSGASPGFFPAEEGDSEKRGGFVPGHGVPGNWTWQTSSPVVAHLQPLSSVAASSGFLTPHFHQPFICTPNSNHPAAPVATATTAATSAAYEHWYHLKPPRPPP